jgi:hypothetical protein
LRAPALFAHAERAGKRNASARFPKKHRLRLCRDCDALQALWMGLGLKT